jgi:hypothetical protein
MPSTYTLISSNVLSSSAASVTFSAIPSTYTDLVLRWSARAATDTNPSSCSIEFNSNTTQGSATYIRVDGSGNPVSLGRTGVTIFDRFASVASDLTANTFSNGEVYVPSYTASANKPVSMFNVNENNATVAALSPLAAAGLFSNTAAITSILFKQLSGNIASGSSFYLYGIKNS